MLLRDFNYTLPSELIAQQPAARREDSRLMVLERNGEHIRNSLFRNIEDHFCGGDVLVINDTRVIPARLHGYKSSGGKIEVFLVRRLHEFSGQCWMCLTRSSKSPRPGTRLTLAQELDAEVLEGGEDGYKCIRFDYSGPDFLTWLERKGSIPLPPYIEREPRHQDLERYQTTFSSVPGAVAAPTAGLHFTAQILHNLHQKGVIVSPLTLHVGLGTFLPVRVDNILEHRMHAEAYSIPEQTAAAVNQAKIEGRRVVALGTTVTRTLEYAATVEQGGQGRCEVQPGSGMTDMFIYPGYQFQIINALLTNFHLPESTLLMLVSAFAGTDFALRAYAEAVKERYRFFSYGDCMLIT
ncbi:MAG: tRNA preQ1(34) S-adenosylmethionine ribosyltransferase-isomerase QueA [Desulfuromonadaceae bacterium]|nr:tRNA preQ1(34) S-adenosylmethionine ribosyltransferase-isomerase QueA [Desulfuromonadaceae bacterium]